MLFYGRRCSTRSRPCRQTLRDIILLNPLAPLLRAGAQVGDRPERARPGRRRRAASAVLIVPVAIYVAICVLAVWVFNREAPRIAEQL